MQFTVLGDGVLLEETGHHAVFLAIAAGGGGWRHCPRLLVILWAQPSPTCLGSAASMTCKLGVWSSGSFGHLLPCELRKDRGCVPCGPFRTLALQPHLA